MLELLRQLRNKYLLWRYVRAGLRLGRNVRVIGKPMFGSEPFLIRIGDHVTVSSEVMFITHDGATWVFRDLPEYKGMERFGAIEIKDNCFIGARAIILLGTTIGPNSIVGAGAVVATSVAPGVVVAGCPARVICTTGEYIRKTVPLCHRYSSGAKRDSGRLQAEVLSALAENDRRDHTRGGMGAPLLSASDTIGPSEQSMADGGRASW